MTDEIREIPTMPKSVHESRQQLHNLIYQLKFAIEDGFSDNTRQHESLVDDISLMKEHNSKQDKKIVYGRIALLIGVLSLCSILYLHSGAELSIAVGGISSMLGIIAKVKGIL